MANPDPNQPHAFHPGPTGRCTYGDASPCGRGKGADIHEGEMVPLLAHDQSTVAPVADPPTSRPKWAELPIPSRVVILAATGGVAAVFVCACITACAVLLRAGGVIG